jgi:hypothetical protein
MGIAASLATVFAPLAARADAPAEAIALFEQGIKDMQGGNLEAGCKELAASLARFSDSGTKGALATCYTRQGKVTSAWNLWKDLADTAPQADDKADAARNASQLEPRLPHFVIKLAGSAPAGLVVTVNGNPADPSLGVPLPVDPGPVTATAHAPDHKDWSQTFQASEGKTVTIDVPALPELPKAPPSLTPPTGPTGPTTGPMTGLPNGPIVLREDNSGSRHSRHVIGASFAIIGLVATGGGAIFGSKAGSQWDSAKSACNGNVPNCPSVGLPIAQRDVNDARTSALISTIGFGVGGAAILTGAILYLSAPSDVEHSTTGMRVTATVAPGSYGFALSGGW